MDRRREQFLLYRIRTQQDQKAFEQLFNKHAQALQRFFLIKLPSREDAEDTYSVTQLRTWKYMLTAREIQSVDGLIFTIARTAVAEFYRSRKVQGVSIDDVGDPEAVFEAQKIVASADLVMIKEIVLGMREDQQLLLTLKFFEDQPIKEIAKRLDKTENATRVALSRALKELRKQINV